MHISLILSSLPVIWFALAQARRIMPEIFKSSIDLNIRIGLDRYVFNYLGLQPFSKPLFFA